MFFYRVVANLNMTIHLRIISCWTRIRDGNLLKYLIHQLILKKIGEVLQRNLICIAIYRSPSGIILNCHKQHFSSIHCSTSDRNLKFPFFQYFATRPGLSPTTLILDLWEAVELGSQRAILDLLQAVRIMGRPEAVLVLEDYLAQSSHLLSNND